MKTIDRIRVSAAALLCAGLFTAVGQPVAPGALPRGAAGGLGDSAVMAAMNPRNAGKLGLDAAQREKLKEIGARARALTGELKRRLGDAVDRQAALMQAENPDEAAVMAAVDALFEVRKELAKVQTRRILEVKALLTAEQLAKAAELVKERREGRRDRGGAAGAPEMPAPHPDPVKPSVEVPAGG